MTSQDSSPSTRYTKKRPAGGTFYYLQVVIIVAIFLATIFTAWSEFGLLPDSLTQYLSSAMAPQAVTSQPNIPTLTPLPRLLIGVVSGHWGNDSGAVCPDGLTEAQVNQEIATRVKESLVGYGYNVDLLKEFDPRLDGYNALVLVSIHADSCDYINDQATGFKVAAAISTFYPERAERLTACLRSRYASATGMSFHPGSVTADMTSYHAFDEIDTETTAAIIETGFLNLDRKMLTKHPDLAANGITQGILCYVRNEDITPQETPTE